MLYGTPVVILLLLTTQFDIDGTALWNTEINEVQYIITMAMQMSLGFIRLL